MNHFYASKDQFSAIETRHSYNQKFVVGSKECVTKAILLVVVFLRKYFPVETLYERITTAKRA